MMSSTRPDQACASRNREENALQANYVWGAAGEFLEVAAAFDEVVLGYAFRSGGDGGVRCRDISAAIGSELRRPPAVPERRRGRAA